MTASKRALISMLSRANKRSSAAEARVKRRVSEGNCLSKIEDPETKAVVDCPNKAGKRRGLCPSCYHVFMSELKKGTNEDSLAYEDQMVSEGMVLGEREKLDLSSNNLLRRRRA